MSPEEFHSLPTPRTDAAYEQWFSGNQAWPTHAQQLERELAVCERALLLIRRDEDTTEAGCLAEETIRLLVGMRKKSK